MMSKPILKIILLFLSISAQAQYIAEVLEYTPAPGQWVNEAPWGVPSSASPDATNSIVGRIDGSMTLGFFGGYTVFRFEEPIDNNPANPYGVDFVLMGNPHNNTLFPEFENRVSFSEPGIVSVMRDGNGNGLPDDTWYELAGCDHFLSTTRHDYAVTYTNPQVDGAVDVPFSDNYDSTGIVESNGFHKHSFYPNTDSFPQIGVYSHTYSGTVVENYVDVSNPTLVATFDRPWGYADNGNRGRYNGLPDNPYTYGVDENSGGDSFDLNWAIDSVGNYVDLDTVHFIKVHTGFISNVGWMGEGSTELTGGFDVSPDASITGETEFVHLRPFYDTIKVERKQMEAFAFDMGRWNPDADISFSTNKEWAAVNENRVLELSGSGPLEVTAYLTERPEIEWTIYLKVLLPGIPYVDDPEEVSIDEIGQLRVYPNPCHDLLSWSGITNGTVELCDLNGAVLLKTEAKVSSSFDMTAFPSGMYLLRLSFENGVVQELLNKR